MIPEIKSVISDLILAFILLFYAVQLNEPSGLSPCRALRGAGMAQW